MDSVQARGMALSTNQAIWALHSGKRLNGLRIPPRLTSKRADGKEIKKSLPFRRSPSPLQMEDLEMYHSLGNLDNFLAKPKPVPRHKRSHLLDPKSRYEDLQIYEDPTTRRSFDWRPIPDTKPEILRSLTPGSLADRESNFDHWYQCYGHLDPATLSVDDIPTGSEFDYTIDTSLAALSFPFKQRDLQVLLLLLRLVVCHYERLKASGQGQRNGELLDFTIEDKESASVAVSAAMCSKDLNFVKSVWLAFGSRLKWDWGQYEDEYENHGRNFSHDYIRSGTY